MAGQARRSLYTLCRIPDRLPHLVEAEKAGEVLTARCSGSEPMRAWPHGWLLNRPKTKDSLLSRRRWDVQGPSGSHLLREPLLGQTLRQQGQKGRISSSEEETRLCSEAGPEGKKATRR